MNKAGRIKKLENRLVQPKRIPHIIHVHTRKGETKDQALNKVIAQWGPIPKGHKFLPVPIYESQIEWERELEEQQTRLISMSLI